MSQYQKIITGENAGIALRNIENMGLVALTSPQIVRARLDASPKDSIWKYSLIANTGIYRVRDREGRFGHVGKEVYVIAHGYGPLSKGKRILEVLGKTNPKNKKDIKIFLRKDEEEELLDPKEEGVKVYSFFESRQLSIHPTFFDNPHGIVVDSSDLYFNSNELSEDPGPPLSKTPGVLNLTGKYSQSVDYFVKALRQARYPDADGDYMSEFPYEELYLGEGFLVGFPIGGEPYINLFPYFINNSEAKFVAVNQSNSQVKTSEEKHSKETIVPNLEAILSSTRDCANNVPKELKKVDLNKLCIEESVPRGKEPLYDLSPWGVKITRQKRFGFDESLAHLKRRGYSRHLRPAEAMSISFNCHDWDSHYFDDEESFDPGDRDIFDGYHSLVRDAAEKLRMNEDAHRRTLPEEDNLEEWLSAAFLRKGNTLFVYMDPENIGWDNDVGYFITGDISSYKFKFKISTDKEKIIPAGDLPNELVELLYGRKFKGFPKMFRKGGQNAGVFMPPENKLVFLSWIMGTFSIGYNSINTLGHYPDAAVSRGVREK